MRPAKQVMRLARLGSFHQCRLSFMRILLRRLKHENWSFDRPRFDIDAKGVGIAVYSAHGPDRTYSLVCFAHDLPDEDRSDRVIAHAWDATFTLFDGTPTKEDLKRLSQNVPKQEAGRISNREISLSRANRSVRMFDYVISCLKEGRQPDPDKVLSVGYLMRTTAVYGSGKFGAIDREEICSRAEFKPPFQAEMLSVYLTRAFILDLVEHMAAAASPDTAVPLEPSLRRKFGVGNSTGLGMAPFIVNHPILFNNWIAAREFALAKVRALPAASSEEKSNFQRILARAIINTERWRSEHPVQQEKLVSLHEDMRQIKAKITTNILDQERPWDQLYCWAEETLSMEGQEQLVSLLLEPHGHLVDDIADCMDADEENLFCIDGAVSVAHLRKVIEEIYDWALKTDWDASENIARIWYVSEEKLEPRLGERASEPLDAYEQPLAIGRDVAAMHQAFDGWDNKYCLADFLLAHPEHRHTARRVQIAEKMPYAEILDNTISDTLMPIDMLRCKLSFFGATHFDPRSDRWVRINMFQNAPFPHELANYEDENWSYPTLDEN
ncbi:MAG: hypothetical protein NXI13_01425 [Proteobacteria bacterium]|nr:hypothetical protein [Pseudomonadota bacterium]